MKKKIFAALTAAVMAVTATASVQGIVVNAQIDTAQAVALNYVMTELGISDLASLVSTMSEDDLVDVSRIYDLDGDNMCGASDASFILEFLNGLVDYQYNYNELDVWEDKVVDKADAMAYLIYFTIGMLDYPGAIPYTATHSAGSYSSQTIQYKKYNAQTGAYLGSYWLTTPAPAASASYTAPPTPASQTFPGESEATVDDRYLDWTQPAVVKLMTNDTTSSCRYHGTGFVIAPHTIATAAHCVKGNTISAVRLFNYAATPPISSPIYYDLTPLQIHYPALADGNNCIKDYALITVQQDLTDYTDINFNLSVPLVGVETSSLPVLTTGFPERLNWSTMYSTPVANNNYGNSNLNQKYTSAGYTCPKLMPASGSFLFNSWLSYFQQIGPDYLTYGLYASLGNSGGPVYHSYSYHDDIYDSVISILTNGPGQYFYPKYHAGPRITSDILKFYYNNPNIQ